MISKENNEKLQKWLGEGGLQFFRDTKTKFGRIDAVWREGNLIHPVHFREGMQVRNFLHELEECKEWDSNKLDNEWVSIVEEAIKQ